MHNANNNELLHELNAWAEQHISLDAVRVQTLGPFVTRVLSEESRFIKETFFKISLWIFGVDDVYDATTFTVNELRAIAALLSQQEPLPATCQFAPEKLAIVNDLNDILGALLAGPVLNLSENEKFYTYFYQILRLTLDAMLEEVERKTSNATVDITAYLKTGKYSVGSSLAQVLLFYLIDKEFFRSDNYLFVNKLLEILGEIIRLLNDKRSYKKELAENKLNSIMIIQQQSLPLADFDEAVHQVNEMIDERVTLLRQWVSSFTDETSKKFGSSTLAVVEATKQFYAIRDFK
ncbi:MAG TPA: terpene synthase family protein [Pseudosphingobacterium sp.]|nr:terpene synthase family protein [Pseudosphingobacterium sp.]